MELNFRNYQNIKIKNYLTKNDFLFFSIGANQNAKNWINVEQDLHKLKLSYHKIYNNKTQKIIKNSIYKNLFNLINGTLFFIKPRPGNEQKSIKNTVVKNLDLILFTTISIKINNKIYTTPQLKNTNSFRHKDNIVTIYQFLLTNLKFSYTLTYKKTISKQCDSNT